jgi:hypothetical protein
MPRKPTIILSVLLAVALHVDWHLARPLHHRLSLEWSHHWLATAGVFLIVGCIIARSWPEHRWRMAAAVVALSAVLAQLVEPVLESLVYDHILAYDVEPARWVAFFKSISAGAVAIIIGLLCARRPFSLRAS